MKILFSHLFEEKIFKQESIEIDSFDEKGY